MGLLPAKAVTEEDARATEARISESFASLRSAISGMPGEAVKPVSEAVKAHPYGAVAAAAAAGFVFYGLLSLVVPRTKVIRREVVVQPRVDVEEREVKSFGSQLLSEAAGLAIPYITAYLERELGRSAGGRAAPPEDEKKA